jgi:hypothetical protein
LSVGEIAASHTYPAVRRRNDQSLNSNWIETNYYQRVTAGRRCSCWGPNTSPSGSCRICWGTGVVGGWTKYGTAHWVLDTTTQNTMLTNITPSFDPDASGPSYFVLDDTAVTGVIETRGSWGGAYGPLDVIDALHWETTGSIKYLIRLYGSSSWKSLTEDNVNDLFSQPAVFDVRVEVSRPTTLSDSPIVGRLLLRILRTPDAETVVRANKPKNTHAMALSELGVIDEWASERWWLNHTLQNITSEDWFYDLGRQYRWKIVDVEKLAPTVDSHTEYLISWDASVRKVQEDEPIAEFPL